MEWSKSKRKRKRKEVAVAEAEREKSEAVEYTWERDLRKWKDFNIYIWLWEKGFFGLVWFFRLSWDQAQRFRVCLQISIGLLCVLYLCLVLTTGGSGTSLKKSLLIKSGRTSFFNLRYNKNVHLYDMRDFILYDMRIWFYVMWFRPFPWRNNRRNFTIEIGSIQDFVKVNFDFHASLASTGLVGMGFVARDVDDLVLAEFKCMVWWQTSSEVQITDLYSVWRVYIRSYTFPNCESHLYMVGKLREKTTFFLTWVCFEPLAWPNVEWKMVLTLVCWYHLVLSSASFGGKISSCRPPDWMRSNVGCKSSVINECYHIVCMITYSFYVHIECSQKQFTSNDPKNVCEWLERHKAQHRN